MSGILNTKSRVMDLIMTQEGRKQLALGGFQVRYASFTDRGTFYDKSSISGSNDSALTRPFFESACLPYDLITVEANDNGNVLPIVSTQSTKGQQVFVYDGTVSTKGGVPVINAPGTGFASYVDDIVKSTTQNFRNQRIIASRDPVDNSDTFVVSTGSINFVYGNRGPIIGEDIVPSVDQAPSLFTHKRFSNSINFEYLPPVVTVGNNTQTLGVYPNVKQTDRYTYDDLIKDLYGKDANRPLCPTTTIRFVETSQTNDICMQAFEINDNTLKKLDMVDFGEVVVNGDEKPNKRVVFMGKVFIDSYQSPTFANIFTIILE
jgi:hypothetical protein